MVHVKEHIPWVDVCLLQYPGGNSELTAKIHCWVPNAEIISLNQAIFHQI